MKKINYFIAFFLLSMTIVGQTEIFIDDPEELTDLTLNAGDTVILANGEYDSDERIKFKGTGTAELPITFRAETPGGVVFTNGLPMNIAGEYLVVDGFHWKGGFGQSNFIQFRDNTLYANYSTIQNCAIDGLGIDPDDLAEDLSPEDPEDSAAVTKHRWVVLYGTYNNVVNCSFMNKVSAGVMVLAEYEFNASPPFDEDAGETGVNTRCLEVGHTITNNYFYKFAKITELYEEFERNGRALSNSGDSETIRIGTSEFQNVVSNVTVSNNYFVEADGENEIITNKSAGNSYINNTFRRCRGSLVLRHGASATVDGNIFLGENVEGTGGIRIVDSNHIITNNYIQDCITVVNQAIWNNGITFMGGNDRDDVICTSTSVTNGYQRSQNITVNNNTIINTNAPLFFNTDRGTTGATGTFTNNLVYFDENSQNLTDVFSGDSNSAFSDIGTSLAYSGNVFAGTDLGDGTSTGFTEDLGISTTENGEIFTVSGAAGKGANLGGYEPTTDAMVGNGIGACFLNNLGQNITGSSCEIEIGDSLTVSAMTTFTFEGGDSNATVNSNVNWSAVSNNDWITIDITSGTTNETVVITVAENEGTEARTGSVTFSQDGGDIVRELSVNQTAAPLPDPRLSYVLINDESLTDNVDVEFASDEEVDPSRDKNNLAIHSLDKDFGTNWSGNGVDAEIIYDLGGNFDLGLIDYLGSNGKTHDFQIWVSTTGIEDADFEQVVFEDRVNERGNLNTNGTNELEAFEFPSVVEDVTFVKIKGFGQPGGSGSTFNTITEIDFYRQDGSLSTVDNTLSETSVYPVPAKGTLYINSLQNEINKIEIINLEGRTVLSEKVEDSNELLAIDTSQLSNGVYVLRMSNAKNEFETKMIIIQN